MTSSSAPASASHPSSYDIPEHPPPTTRMRKPHSGLPSSRRRSDTFLAAVSVSVIIPQPPVSDPGVDADSTLNVSQNPTGGEQRQLLERGALGQRRHEDRGLRDVLGAEHRAPIRR